MILKFTSYLVTLVPSIARSSLFGIQISPDTIATYASLYLPYISSTYKLSTTTIRDSVLLFPDDIAVSINHSNISIMLIAYIIYTNIYIICLTRFCNFRVNSLIIPVISVVVAAYAVIAVAENIITTANIKTRILRLLFNDHTPPKVQASNTDTMQNILTILYTYRKDLYCDFN